MTNDEETEIRAYVAERAAARARGEHIDSDERREVLLLAALDEARDAIDVLNDRAERAWRELHDLDPVLPVDCGSRVDAARQLKAERDEATNRAAAAEKCAAEQADALRALHEAWTSGGQLAADMPIPFSHATTDEARAVSTHLVGMAATFLRNEVLANPDAQKRNGLCVAIVYGDEPWHLTMARETNDVSFGLLMQRQKQEVQRDLAEARSQLAALHAAAYAFAFAVYGGKPQSTKSLTLDRVLADLATAAAEHERRVRADERAKALREAADKILATNEGRDRMTPLAMHLRAMADEAERRTR